MDVNETLARIRAAMTERTIAHSVEESAWLGEQIANAFADLDEWLSGGGYLPDEWSAETIVRRMNQAQVDHG